MKEQKTKQASVESINRAERSSSHHFSNCWKFVLLGCIFLIALGIRLKHIDTPFLEFHATRQYHSAIITRDYYFQQKQDTPEWKKTMATKIQLGMPHLEPRIMETLVLGGYLLNGGEAYWIPRIYSIVFWLIGGMFLYGIARRYFCYSSAVITLCFYLFLPYGIVASRAFQRDPLVMMLMLATWWGLVRYAHNDSTKYLGFATLMASLTFLVRIQVMPIIDGAFMIMWLMGGNFRRPSG